MTNVFLFAGYLLRDQLAKDTLDHDTDSQASVHYADLNPLVNYSIQQLVRIKWGCSCIWQKSLSLETNTRATKEFQAINQSWRIWNNPNSNWPYQGHKVQYLVPETAEYFSTLWSNADHWPYAPVVCSVTGKLWQILHRWLHDYFLWDNSWDLHSGIPAGCEILLSDMNGQTFYNIHHLNHSRTDVTFLKFNWSQTWTIELVWISLFRDWNWLQTPTCVGWLICPEGRVSSLNKCNPMQSRQSWLLAGNIMTQSHIACSIFAAAVTCRIPLIIQRLSGIYISHMFFLHRRNTIGCNPVTSSIARSPCLGCKVSFLWRWGGVWFSPCLLCLKNRTAQYGMEIVQRFIKPVLPP